MPKGEAHTPDVPAPPLHRVPRRSLTSMVPQPVPSDPGLVAVDSTWGTLTPIELAPGVRTVGELEVIEHVRAGRPLVDTRRESFYVRGTIPGARNIPHETIGQAIQGLDRSVATVFFCNGPQCAATPAAIHALLAAGYPPGGILFYRGGIHDWITLGLPTEIPRGDPDGAPDLPAGA